MENEQAASAAAEEKVAVRPEVDPAIVAKIAQEAVRKEVEAAQKLSAESTKKLLDEQRSNVLRALGAEDPQAARDEFTARFLTDPAEVLGNYAALTKEQAIAEVRKEIAQKEAAAAQEREAVLAEQRAVGELFSERPDLKQSAELRETLEAYYLKTDSSLPAKERLEQATKKLDKFLEKLDGKTSAERVKALASVTANSSVGAEPPARKSQAEVNRADIEARKEREMKVRRGISSRIQFS